MNSGLQCLSNTKELAQIFIDNSYKRDLNTTNKIGTGGKLAKAFAALMKEMWTGTAESVSPWAFKRELGDFVPQFYGFQQQDSHELIGYVLDLLHEDLNRVKKKPTPSEITTNGLSEEEIAQRFWENYLSRNQSRVVDLMCGQYRSQVTCPACQNVSLTFDPFTSVSVTISVKNRKRAIEGYFMPFDIRSPVVKYRVDISLTGKIAEFRQLSACELAVDADSLVIGKAAHFTLMEIFNDETPLGDFPQYYSYVAMEVPKQTQKALLLVDFAKKPESRYYQKNALCLSRPILIDAEASLYDLYREIDKFFAKVQLIAAESSAKVSKIASVVDQSTEGAKPYSLFLVNLQREKFLGAGGSSSTERAPCDYCKRRDCTNCALPSEKNVRVRSVMEKNHSGKVTKIEVVITGEFWKTLTPLVITQVHQSVMRGAEEDRRKREQSFTLQDCLRLSALPETLDAENEVYCSRCKKHVQAEKQMSLYRLPPVLIIHLKRFKDRGYRKEKDERVIQFPITGLDMREFVSAQRNTCLQYDLYAVSNHYGGLGGGHYTAYAKNWASGEWGCFNDSKTERIADSVEETVVTPAAYVLFYRRREDV